MGGTESSELMADPLSPHFFTSHRNGQTLAQTSVSVRKRALNKFPGSNLKGQLLRLKSGIVGHWPANGRIVQSMAKSNYEKLPIEQVDRESKDRNGTGAGIRTPDTRIMIPVL